MYYLLQRGMSVLLAAAGNMSVLLAAAGNMSIYYSLQRGIHSSVVFHLEYHIFGVIV